MFRTYLDLFFNSNDSFLLSSQKYTTYYDTSAFQFKLETVRAQFDKTLDLYGV